MLDFRITRHFELSRSEAALLELLLKEPVVTTETIEVSLVRHARQLVGNLRKKLVRVDESLKIETRFAQGYFMHEEARELIYVSAGVPVEDKRATLPA